MALSIFESNQSLLKFEGPDVLTLLQGALSNDLRLLEQQKTLRAFHLTPKGKWVARLLLFKKGNIYLAITSRPKAEALKLSLKNILFLSERKMEDLSDHYSLFLQSADDASQFIKSEEESILDDEWARPAAWFIILKNEKEAFLQKLKVPCFSTTDLEAFQLESKIPRYGTEVNEKTIPPQAGYGDNYFSYNKGCYVGQEIISRLKHYGQKDRPKI